MVSSHAKGMPVIVKLLYILDRLILDHGRDNLSPLDLISFWHMHQWLTLTAFRNIRKAS